MDLLIQTKTETDFEGIGPSWSEKPDTRFQIMVDRHSKARSTSAGDQEQPLRLSSTFARVLPTGRILLIFSKVVLQFVLTIIHLRFGNSLLSIYGSLRAETYRIFLAGLRLFQQL